MRHIGLSRREQFEQIDQPALKPLPKQRYQLAHWKTVRVNIDYHIALEHNFYSVPYQLIHEPLEARYTTSTVELYRLPAYHLPSTPLRPGKGFNSA